MLKVVTVSGEPVELDWKDARELARLLMRLADEGERADDQQGSREFTRE